MFVKLASFTTIALLAVATPAIAQACCDTGSAECCETVQPAGSSSIAPILAAIGVVVQDVNVPVGVGCTPITAIGAGSSGCDASPVCCEDTSHGAVAIGCVPVGLDL